jgi:hypothetical protein
MLNNLHTTQRGKYVPDTMLNPVLTTDVIVTGEPWPPKTQRERLIRYAQNKMLYTGKHDLVYDQWASMIADNPDVQRALVYIAVNLPGAITRLVADLLYGEAGANLHATCQNAQATEALTRILDDCHMLQAAYETGGLGASYRGDGVYKVYLQDGQARIVSQPAQYWFPIASSANIKEIERHIIAWPVQIGDKKYLRKEIHERGYILNYAYELEGNQIGQQVDLATVGESRPEREDTGLRGFTVFHNPNLALDDELFGLDDYMDLDSLFPVYNVLLSRNDLILMKHSDPNMYGPEDNLEPDPNDPDKLRVRTSGGYFPVGPDEAPPGYLEWDGKLEAAFKQMETLLQAIYLVSETSPAAFGLDKEGGTAESGRALRFRLMRTIAKVQRKRIYADTCLKDLFETALQLEASRGIGKYTPERPSIDWQDGLPNDPLEDAQLTQTRGVERSMTTVDAIQMLDKVDEATARKRAAEIQAEMDAALPSFARSPFSAGAFNLNNTNTQTGTGEQGTEGGTEE